MYSTVFSIDPKLRYTRIDKVLYFLFSVQQAAYSGFQHLTSHRRLLELEFEQLGTQSWPRSSPHRVRTNL